MTDASQLTMFDGEDPSFEKHGRENGITTWSGRQFAHELGYATFEGLRGAINRAQQVCLSLEIDVTEHFKQELAPDGRGGQHNDVRLSRFGCYLVAMNGDIKKPMVAKAQVYFARFADACRQYIAEAGEIDRVIVREEITEHDKALCSTAKAAGVLNYGYFTSAGYRGLYNMAFGALKARKGVPDSRSPLDFMGREELAANLFRVTQTDAKIKRENIRGQAQLEHAAETVGKQVRKSMHEISGQRPEDLEAAEDIRKVKTGLRATGRGLQGIDATRRRKLPPPSP